MWVFDTPTAGSGGILASPRTACRGRSYIRSTSVLRLGMPYRDEYSNSFVSDDFGRVRLRRDSSCYANCPTGTETMFESNSIPCPDNTKQPRWNRSRITAEVVAFEATAHRTISQRQFAQERGLPRTTLQYWLSRKATIDADPSVIAFFESPVGLAFLHRLLITVHFVFTQVGPCGIRLICQFLELSKLDRFVAASHGAQQQVSQKMQAGLATFGAQERSRLAQGMAPKKITICEDETFHPETCLVAIEPVSDFILVEKYAKHRDAET